MNFIQSLKKACIGGGSETCLHSSLAQCDHQPPPRLGGSHLLDTLDAFGDDMLQSVWVGFLGSVKGEALMALDPLFCDCSSECQKDILL